MPQLNLLAPAALGGLLYRVLAGTADPAEAELTRRSLEQLQEQRTGLLQEISSLRAEVEILSAQAYKARQAANQARLDVELFERQTPPRPKRGLLNRKLSPDQQATEQQRAQLHTIAGRNASDHEQAACQERKQRQTLAQLEESLKQLQLERHQQATLMQDQLAARVLNLTAAGQGEEALLLLEETRRLVRGDMMAVALTVIVALLTGGLEAALPVLGQFRTVFSQQGESVSRVLSALLAVSRGRQLKRQELGLLPAENLPTPAFFRLYQLVRVLAGWDYDAPALAGHPAGPLLSILGEYISDNRGSADSAGEQTHGLRSAAELSNWSEQSGDLIVRVLCAMLLRRRGELALIPQAAGLDPPSIEPPKRPGGAWPSLWGMLGEPPAAWPRALDAPWRAVLASLALLGVRESAPKELFEAWLAESYNWPKSDLYWWTLSQVRDDQALLTNLSGDPAQLVSVAPV
jgi:hypothetical protein